MTAEEPAIADTGDAVYVIATDARKADRMLARSETTMMPVTAGPEATRGIGQTYAAAAAVVADRRGRPPEGNDR